MILKSLHDVDHATMRLVKQWAQDRSKDPSTKVGAAIYDPVSGAHYLGYNGFPPGWPDGEEQWRHRFGTMGGPAPGTYEYSISKYDLVIHAEVNAVRKALGRVDVSRCTLYCTHLPCPECFKSVVLANGIQRVVYAEESWPSQSPRDLWLVKTLAVDRVKLVQLKEE